MIGGFKDKQIPIQTEYLIFEDKQIPIQTE